MLDGKSRYANVGTRTGRDASGREIVHLRRRFVPPPDRGLTAATVVLRDAERLDLVAARLLGDPRQFWRLCDASPVLDPFELERPGRVLRVAVPEADS